MDVWRTSIIYTKLQGNMSINSITRQWLNHHLSQHLKYVPTTVRWHITHLCLLKLTVQCNHSVNLQRHWMSNIRLLFRGLVQLGKSIRQSKNSMCCGHILKSDRDIQEKQRFTDALYYWILHNPQVVQSPIENNCICVSIDGNSKKYYFRSFYWKFLYKNFIIACWYLQKKV